MIKVNLIPLKKSIPTDDIPKPPVKVVTAPIPASNPEPEDESLDEIWDAVELAESPLKDVRMFQPLASDIANSLTEKNHSSRQSAVELSQGLRKCHLPWHYAGGRICQSR